MPFSTSFLLGRSADYTQAEIQEFERRVRNFSLFDRVTVAVRDQTLAIEVQEKFTLAPILNFTSGSSPQDLNATGGLVEYNIAGGPIQLQSTRTGTSRSGFYNMPTVPIVGRRKSRERITTTGFDLLSRRRPGIVAAWRVSSS